MDIGIYKNLKPKYFIFAIINGMRRYFTNIQFRRGGVISGILFILGLKKEIKIDIKRLGEVNFCNTNNQRKLCSFIFNKPLKNISSQGIENIKQLIECIDEDIITINGVSFNNSGGVFIQLLFEVFIWEEYYLDECLESEKTVIDVGANIGDSSLYFANKGYTVFGFEPISEVYSIATENINLNPELKYNVTLINKAVSCKKGKIKIYKNPENSGGHSGYGSNNEYNYDEFDLVETTTLGNIINEYNIDPYALKIDCEGCEVDIIMNSDLSDFKIIYFEHHNFLTGINHEILVNKLKSEGFMIVGENKFNKQVDTILMRNNFK